ncbi:MAG: GAF domain-containing protein [Chloroflexi bacterium]|uniref:histidine kinase n=1 Tax=Candidatus Chlorohelix allophototropha TaxID=3003348 RepID=A0A8T7M8P1_9CHLR|nr:GAF domain-containing protein [Chloroflexota bacterium]WJW68358.1 GAF domain-containing protein [Chloroflexota bacterium L227-S17]
MSSGPYEQKGYFPIENPTGESSNFGLIQRLQALAHASLAISSELDLTTVLQRIADTAREFANAQYAALGIVNEQGIITSFITSGISPQDREQIGQPPRGHGLLGVLIKQGKAIRVRDIATDPRRSGFPPNHPVMTSLLGVPVSINDKIVGDLYMTDKRDANEFTPEDEWWLTLFARQAAVAMINARLYNKVERAHKRAEMLAEMADVLNRTIDPEELFGQITQAACLLLELPAAALYVFEEKHNRFSLKAQVGLNPETCIHTFQASENSPAAKLLKANETISLHEKADLEHIQPFLDGVKPSAMLIAPIRQYSKINGVLEVYSATARRFTLEDKMLLETFATKAGLALEKAQLYREKERFLSMTAHDLRAPLAAIKMSAGLLETSLPPDLSPALLRLVANIRRNSERLNNLLSDLLDATRLEQGSIRLRVEPLEVVEAVAATAHTLTPLFDERSQKFSLEKPYQEYWVMADRRRLEQVMVNLLTNAIKYTSNGGKVTVGILVEEKWITIEVKDSGNGIPEEEMLHIFDRFYRRPIHEQNDTTSGTGLGLSIARSLVELHGGTIWVESEVGVGTSFFVKLPRYIRE